MSPTPEQLATLRSDYAKEIAKKEAIQKRLSELNNAIGSVSQKCCEIVGGEDHKDDCVFIGYLLDKTRDIVSLHPIIHETLAGGGGVMDIFFLMVGSNFSESLEINDPSFNQVNKFACARKDILINDRKGWQERYPLGPHFIYNDNQLAVGNDNSSYYPRGIVDGISIIRKDIGFDVEIKIKEEMVVALANAAGIKATDEKSDDFPLLLEQLKKIEAEKGK